VEYLPDTIKNLILRYLGSYTVTELHADSESVRIVYLEDGYLMSVEYDKHGHTTTWIAGRNG